MKRAVKYKSIKIYLQNKRRPFIIELPNHMLDRLYADLESNAKIIHLGKISFARKEFLYGIEKN